MTKKSLNDWIRELHRVAHDKGFYYETCAPPCKHVSGGPVPAIMLVVTELSEAVEAIRNGDIENFNEEIADAAIRLFDLCGAEDIDLEYEISKKNEKNKQRPFRHGKEF